MHIVFEGPDGAGKSTLARHILAQFGLNVATRASTSSGGPIVNVDRWVEDVETFIFHNNVRNSKRESFAFDRHAIISEPIYSTALGRPTAEMFNLPWWVKARRQELYNHTLVVFCIPEFHVIDANVHNPQVPQMPGVTNNIHEIYVRYINCWQNWGGPAVRYDYTTTDLESFTEMIGKWVNLDGQHPSHKG